MRDDELNKQAQYHGTSLADESAFLKQPTLKIVGKIASFNSKENSRKIHPTQPFTPTSQQSLKDTTKEEHFLIAENHRLHEQLLAQQKWAAIGQMLTHLAHDLRNPMSAIALHAELLTQEIESKKREQRHQIMLHHLNEMAAMISDVLAYARGDNTLHAQSIELSDLEEDIQSAIYLLCKPHHVEVIKHIQPGSAIIDLGRTKRILYNLLKNAAEASPIGAKIWLDISSNEHHVHIQIKDNGLGLPKDVLERLQNTTEKDPYYHLLPSHKSQGSGFGLAIVQRFVNDQNGTFSVDSKEGCGTVFDITLPHMKSKHYTPG